MAIENVATSALLIGIIIVSLIVILALIAGIYYFYLNWKKYQEYECVILHDDGSVAYDSAGIFVDRKTNNKRFYLKKANSSLDPNNVPFKITPKGKKIVFLHQIGLKNFAFIKVDLDVNENGLATVVEVGEEDVNWAINSYERSKKIFANNWLLNYMPYIALFFVSVIILMIFVYFFKEFRSLKEFAVVMKEVAEIMRQARAGTTVI